MKKVDLVMLPRKFEVVDLSLVTVKKKHNPREKAAPSKELTSSINKNGVLVPIGVREAPKGKLWLIDGERRWRASLEAGKETIPALHYGKITDEEALLAAIVSNMDQLTLTKGEMFHVCQRLIDLGLSNEEIGGYLGRSVRQIKCYRRIEKKGTEKLKNAVGSSNPKKHVSAAVGEQIANLPEKEQDKVVDVVKGQSVKVGKVISAKNRTILGAVAKPRPKNLRPIYEPRSQEYELVPDALERVKIIEEQARKKIEFRKDNAELQAYLDVVEVLKGNTHPMSLFEYGPNAAWMYEEEELTKTR